MPVLSILDETLVDVLISSNDSGGLTEIKTDGRIRPKAYPFQSPLFLPVGLPIDPVVFCVSRILVVVSRWLLKVLTMLTSVKAWCTFLLNEMESGLPPRR
jgi:hypothetical protein